MTPSTSSRLFNVVFWVSSLALAGYIAWILVSDIRTRQTTGQLIITAFATNASISVSSNNKGAVLVGTGTAKIRLSPGSYQIVASSDGSFGTAQAVIHKGDSSTVAVKKAQGAAVPSPDNITFSGMNTLVQRGITVEQDANLRKLFFKYKQTAQTITINTSTIAHGPRNPNDDNAPFTLNFNVAIDSQTYGATITYTDLINLELTLFDPQTGNKVYDANSVQSVPGS